MAIDSRLRAYTNPITTGLSFEIMRLSAEESDLVTATGISSSGQKAGGKITVYNNYSNAPQKLIINTRFQTSDGKIYRIREPIVIPGMGVKEATVYADPSRGRI